MYNHSLCFGTRVVEFFNYCERSLTKIADAPLKTDFSVRVPYHSVLKHKDRLYSVLVYKRSLYFRVVCSSIYSTP